MVKYQIQLNLEMGKHFGLCAQTHSAYNQLGISSAWDHCKQPTRLEDDHVLGMMKMEGGSVILVEKPIVVEIHSLIIAVYIEVTLSVQFAMQSSLASTRWDVIWLMFMASSNHEDKNNFSAIFFLFFFLFLEILSVCNSDSRLWILIFILDLVFLCRKVFFKTDFYCCWCNSPLRLVVKKPGRINFRLCCQGPLPTVGN